MDFSTEVRDIFELVKGLKQASEYPNPRSQHWYKVPGEVTGVIGNVDLTKWDFDVVSDFEFTNCYVELSVGDQPWGPLKTTDMLNLHALRQRAFNGKKPLLSIVTNGTGTPSMKYCGYFVQTEQRAFICKHGWWGRQSTV